MSGPSDWPLPEDGVRFIVPHSLVSALQNNDLTRGLYLRAMGYYPNARGHYVNRDEHTDDLVLYCVGGEGSLSTGGQTYQVAKGDVLLLPRGVPHSYGASSERPWTVYWMHFSGTDAEAFWRHLGCIGRGFATQVGVTARLSGSMESLIKIASRDLLENSLIYGSNLLREILTLLKVMRDKSQESSSSFSVDAIHAFMHKSLHIDLDLDTLAQTANMSRHAFSRRYKTLTGVSPYRYYLYLKMQRACQLLDATDQTVAQVAEVMGYRDPYYFSRVFRQIIGMPPSQFRKKRYD